MNSLTYRLCLFLIPLTLLCCKCLGVYSGILKIQLRGFDFQPVQGNVEVQLDHRSPAFKNNEGKCEFAILDQTSHALIEIIDQNLKVFFPVNGNIVIPGDFSETIDVIIGSDKDYGTLVSLWPMIKKIKANESNACAFAEELLRDIKNLKEDSVLLRQKRDSAFSAISKSLNNYLNHAVDLKNTLLNFDTIYFNRENPVKYLNSQINGYNDEWKYFQENKDVFRRVVNVYWQSPANQNIQLYFINVIQDIESIHQSYFLSFTDVIKEFNYTLNETDEKIKKQKLKIVFEEFKKRVSDNVFSAALQNLEAQNNSLMTLLNQ